MVDIQPQNTCCHCHTKMMLDASVFLVICGIEMITLHVSIQNNVKQHLRQPEIIQSAAELIQHLKLTWCRREVSVSMM